MASEHEAVSPLHGGKTPEENWGAEDSLRRNASVRRTSLQNVHDNEDTPLLGNGSGGDGGSEGNSNAEFEGYTEFEGLPWWRRPSVIWLLPPFFMFALAFGGILVPKLNLIKSLVCREYFIAQAAAYPNHVFAPVLLGGDDNPQCEIPEVQKLIARFTLYLTVIAGMLGAVMSPKLGSLSDRYGRTRLLVVTSMGGFLTEIITIAAGTYPDTVKYQWLLAGAAFDGLCGSFTTGMALTHAYASDCTPPQKRGVAFGYFHACLFSGIAFGPLLVALLLKNGGKLIWIFYIALVVHFAFMLFIGLVAPESLSKKRQRLAREKYAADIAIPENPAFSPKQIEVLIFLRHVNILRPLKILWPTGPGTSTRLRANLVLLAAVDTTMFGVGISLFTVIVYYLGFMFHWNTSQSSAFVSIINIVRVSCLIIVLPLLSYLVRTRRANRQRRDSGFAVPEPSSGSDNLDLGIIRAAVLFEIFGFTGYILARSGEVFTIAGIFAAIGGIGSPTLQSALTKHVPRDKVGQLLGATGLLHALARVVAPTILNVIYAQTVGTFPQTVFVVLLGCFFVAFTASWFIRPHVYLEEPDRTTGNAERPNTTRTLTNPDILIDEEIVGN